MLVGFICKVAGGWVAREYNFPYDLLAFLSLRCMGLREEFDGSVEGL